jgi:hypothetical protein
VCAQVQEAEIGKQRADASAAREEVHYTHAHTHTHTHPPTHPPIPPLPTHARTHTHTHTYLCVCVCVYDSYIIYSHTIYTICRCEFARTLPHRLVYVCMYVCMYVYVCMYIISYYVPTYRREFVHGRLPTPSRTRSLFRDSRIWRSRTRVLRFSTVTAPLPHSTRYAALS